MPFGPFLVMISYKNAGEKRFEPLEQIKPLERLLLPFTILIYLLNTYSYYV